VATQIEAARTVMNKIVNGVSVGAIKKYKDGFVVRFMSWYSLIVPDVQVLQTARVAGMVGKDPAKDIDKFGCFKRLPGWFRHHRSNRL
ncbi:MAG: hypothetical protein ACXADD_12410, partial [Candidatus Thorarchaeota archaeon]